jgi:hypothetical protein
MFALFSLRGSFLVIPAGFGLMTAHDALALQRAACLRDNGDLILIAFFSPPTGPAIFAQNN